MSGSTKRSNGVLLSTDILDLRYFIPFRRNTRVEEGTSQLAKATLTKDMEREKWVGREGKERKGEKVNG